MLRVLDDLPDRADLGEPPGIHDGDAVGGLGDDAHVVGHQHDRGAVVAAETLQQRDDLRLDRDVERRRRLVGDDEPRVGAEREGDDDALPHAAGEMMRITVDAPFGAWDADFLQELDRAPPRRRAVEVEMGLDGFDELAPDGVERIEAGQRILEDRADLLAAQPPHLRAAQIVDPLPVEQDTPAGDVPRRLEEADDRGAGQRLAGARFADDAQHLALGDIEADAVDRRHGAAPCREGDAEILDLEQRASAALPAHRLTLHGCSPRRARCAAGDRPRNRGDRR